MKCCKPQIFIFNFHQITYIIYFRLADEVLVPSYSQENATLPSPVMNDGNVTNKNYQAKDNTTLLTSPDRVFNTGPRIRRVQPRLKETDAVSTLKTIIPAEKMRCVFLWLRSVMKYIK